MSSRLIFVFAAAVACAEPATEAASTRASGDAGLVGAWDARMSLTQPYQLELRDPPRQRICGAIGFVESNEATPGLKDSARLVGVYSLNLSDFGLRWRDDLTAPIASATYVARKGHADTGADDSLVITLKSSDHETIVLRGLRVLNEIRGAWTAQSSRGDASGFFQMRRREPGSTSWCQATPRV